MYMCMYVCVCISIYLSIYLSIYIYIYIYIYILYISLYISLSLYIYNQRCYPCLHPSIHLGALRPYPSFVGNQPTKVVVVVVLLLLLLLAVNLVILALRPYPSFVGNQPTKMRTRLSRTPLGIHYRGLQWEGGAVDGGSIR